MPIYIFVAYLNESWRQLIFQQQTNQIHSEKFKQARIVSLLLDITTPRVTYEKYATRFLDVLFALILRVWTSVFCFTVKHSRPYKNCGYSRGCKYDFDFFTHTFLHCFPLRIMLFDKTKKIFFPFSHSLLSICGWGGGGRVPLSYSSRIC